LTRFWVGVSFFTSKVKAWLVEVKAKLAIKNVHKVMFELENFMIY
jgi:hypothetical protein